MVVFKRIKAAKWTDSLAFCALIINLGRTDTDTAMFGIG